MKYEVCLLIDRSGSMQYSITDTISGVNEIIETLKTVSTKDGVDISLDLLGFSDDCEHIAAYEDVNTAKEVSKKEIFADAGTRMFNAIDYSLSHIEDESKHKRVLFIVFTDGHTAIRNEISAKDIKDKIEKSGHTFIFVHPGSIGEYHDIGIPESNIIKYNATKTGLRDAFKLLSTGVKKYFYCSLNSEVLKDNIFSNSMKVNGLEVTINTPKAFKKDDVKNTLPPYSPALSYVVDEYPACPTSWMNGSSKASSYFIPVNAGDGLWIDFNKLHENEYDVAAVISVQGINPITGQKTSNLRLEKYENKCPLHDEEFAQDRFCKSCGYKWPAANYISTISSKAGEFWLDGFRSSDGKVKQYVFTEDQIKGVAKNIIGDDRVFAIGIAFFLSKKPKKVQAGTIQRGFPSHQGYLRGMTQKLGFFGSEVNSQVYISGKAGGVSCSTAGFSNSITCSTADKGLAAEEKQVELSDFSVPMSFEVGAGESINQNVNFDSLGLDYWQEEPAGMIYINYVDENFAKFILSKGKRKEVDGFLASIPTGN